MQEASIKKEPVTALLSGQDGLDHYKKLLKQLPKYLNKKYLIKNDFGLDIITGY